MGTLPLDLQLPPAPPRRKALTADVDDFTLHADTAVAAHDREGLERLARYGARPPFAHRRLRLTASGKVVYRLRRPWMTGQTEIVLEPVAFLRRLAALIPPPRQNQTRYHGVFAPNASLRAAVTALVPGGPRHDLHAAHHGAESAQPAAAMGGAWRLPWAELFRRVFRDDLLVCPRCAGGMRVLAAITDPAVVTAILSHLRLPTAAPVPSPARAPPLREAWPGAQGPVPDEGDTFADGPFLDA